MPTRVLTTEVGGQNSIVDLVTPGQNVARHVSKDLTTDLVANLSTIPGATLTQALDNVQTPATGSEPGYFARYGYVDAASARLGTMFAGVQLEAAPTVWTDPSHIPPGSEFEFVQVGSAGGSGSGAATRGATGTSSLNGGGPSGGGAMNRWRCTRADLIAALPIAFLAPLGGLGGAPVQSNNNAVINGNPGLDGAACSIIGVGLRELAGGGLHGNAGLLLSTGAAGSGGGQINNAVSETVGGPPNDIGTTTGGIAFATIGGSPANTRTSTGSAGTLQMSIWGGSGGGSNNNTTSIVHGGRSKYGACGGGHGGRYSLLTGLVTPSTSDGGNHDVTITGAPWGGGGGLGGTANGEAGGDGPDGNALQAGQGAGGGQAASGPAAIGGAGGRGGFPGGGSGGGGASFSTGVGPATSGSGQPGADALILLTVLS